MSPASPPSRSLLPTPLPGAAAGEAGGPLEVVLVDVDEVSPVDDVVLGVSLVVVVPVVVVLVVVSGALGGPGLLGLVSSV
ncbi:hypothetical protein BN000_00544 [Mycobacterium europaeum]|uniref:Uncharacterized protein n=1 Tax=Mycobacterium europaeum TaxID=761804 RepID=A0A0U1CWN6_9MYCO|nr:hypothetical protein BN000_00544 [Mycobacterium europaeum]